MTDEEIEQILAPPDAERAAWCHFDAEWYVLAYPECLSATGDATFSAVRRYYLDHGRRLGHAPNMYFDESFYLQLYPDAAEEIAAGLAGSGYEHYCRFGYPDRTPHWLYDEATYRIYSDDLNDAILTEYGCFNRYDHFLRSGAAEGRIAHLLFDPDFYTDRLMQEGGALEGASPFAHFLARAWRERRDAKTSVYFDPDWYAQRYPEAWIALAQGTHVCALHHYLTAADGKMRDPLAAFSEGYYRATHPEISVAPPREASSQPGYAHFLARGVFDFASPRPTIDLPGYLDAYEQVGAAIRAGRVRDAFAHLLTSGLEAPAPAAKVPAPVANDTETATTALPAEEAATPAPDGVVDAATEAAAAPLQAGGRPAYTGVSTLNTLQDRVLLEIDEAIFCPPDGLMLTGWVLANPGVVTTLRLHSGETSFFLDPTRFVRIGRPDVLASVGAQHGFQEPRSGFLAYTTGAYRPEAGAYLSVTTARGETGYRGVPEPRLQGMPAIRFVLNCIEARYGEVAPAFDRVLGPCVASLNRERLRERPHHEVIAFGAVPEAPELSIIVPLFGRMDFLEYQLAFFSRHRGGMAHEFIYVLDDPALQRTAETLAASVYARFGTPFRLVVLSRNVGYAPVNNIGLELARGTYVCLLNSDVFAGTPDWMERLVARLRADPGLGAVGPLLLFEDETVQHLGMRFEPIPEFAGWLFPRHERKGWRRPAEGGLRRCVAITGACLVISRAVLEELGGLDESFVIGDFEDADLCMRLARQGLACAVDLDVSLYHLERQSQAGPDERWRMNLTLYNAWVHERRWGAMLRQQMFSS
jgi:GT2 family glycosyltransferase